MDFSLFLPKLTHLACTLLIGEDLGEVHETLDRTYRTIRRTLALGWHDLSKMLGEIFRNVGRFSC